MVTFSHAFQEWRNCQYEISKQKKEPLFACPACDASQHSVHIDGNKNYIVFLKFKGNIYVNVFNTHCTDLWLYTEAVESLTIPMSSLLIILQ